MNEQNDLVKKIYKSIVIAWAIAMFWCVALWKPWIALSITLGTILATALLFSLDCTVRRFFVPGTTNPGRSMMLVGFIKYLIIGVILFFLVRWHSISLPAFCGGVVLVHVAIVAKVVGVRMVERRNESGIQGLEGG
jgi:hypothetical protein